MLNHAHRRLLAAATFNIACVVSVAAAKSAEVQVSTSSFGDIEFDWGRDGINCPTCNFGQGNARFNWTDQNGNLWIGHLDPTSGAFTPTAGQNELADTSAFYWSAYGNGPEWAFSTQNGQVVSQLVYTRYTPGQPATSSNAGVGFATPVAGGWAANFFPGAMGPAPNGSAMNTVLPEASQCTRDPVALTLYKNLSKPKQMFWEPTSLLPGTAPVLTPFGNYSNGIGERWIPCTHQLVFEGSALKNSPGYGFMQVYWYDTDTNVAQALTTDANDHSSSFMFQAPEFNDAYVLVTVSANLEIDIYKQTGTLANGAPSLSLINQIRSPDSAEPYISSTEPFVHCTPVCKSYIFMTLSSVSGPQDRSTGNGLAVTNIDPAQPMFKILVSAASKPVKQRADPEYYITPNGAYLYYGRIAAQSSTSLYHKEGEFYIDMQLGAPSGSCVGSSAEGGMLPGC